MSLIGLAGVYGTDRQVILDVQQLNEAAFQCCAE